MLNVEIVFDIFFPSKRGVIFPFTIFIETGAIFTIFSFLLLKGNITSVFASILTDTSINALFYPYSLTSV